MESFPIELIEAILASPKLKMEDIVNFSSTCSHFRQIVIASSYIWRVKFKAKWPEFMKLFDNDFADWYDETCYIFNLKKSTRQLLASMSVKCYKKVELSNSDYDNWIGLVNENPRTYHYLISDLMEIVNTHVPIKSIKVVPIDIPGNKTLQYYAQKVLRYLRQVQLSKEWEEYISKLYDKQILEVGFAIISQWCQPDVDVSTEIISNKLDDLANEVKLHIKINYPKHLLNKASLVNLQLWKESRLERSAWNPLECKQLIKSIAHVLYSENKFSKSIEEFQTCEALFINKVLENKVGLPITLAIIYEAVARRVGLKCDTIIVPSHFLIRFTEVEGENITDSYYIDTLRDGNIFRRDACPHARNNVNYMNNLTPPATSLTVLKGLISNLEMVYRSQQTLSNKDVVRLRSILELAYLVMPYTATSIINLLRLYVLYDIDTKPLENSIRVFNMESFSEPRIQEAINTLTNDKKSHLEPINQGIPKSRPENVKYAVGMVMKHFVLGYTCVIFDWNPVCMASVEWQLQMGVHKLGHKHEQPFYNVIVEDGSHRYAAQENIIPVAIANPTKLLCNERLGKYFSHFFENHFVPNAEMENEFPEDADVRYKVYQKLKNL